LAASAKTLGIKEDLLGWSTQWLTTSGINVIRSEYVEVEGLITDFALEQSIYKYGENRLRK
jgi:hypothetical protein